MQIDLDDNDAYAAPPMPAGGLATGGSFGEDALSTPAAATQYLQRINPNVIVIGGFVIGGVFALNTLVAGLGQANPNNQMLQANQVTAEANGTALTATTEALKTVANQRPSCIAIVCNFPRTAPDEGFPPELLPAETVDRQQQQQTQDYATQQQHQPNSAGGSFPRQGLTQPIAATALNVTDTPDYWRQQWQQHPDYVQQYIAYCQQQSIGWKSSDCQALYWTLQ